MLTFTQYIEAEGHFDDGQGNVFWGTEASGVLPIAQDTKRICLALRSNAVTSRIGGRTVNRRCWGTFGGAMDEGDSPEENAKNELGEETGYRGAMRMIPAYVFSSGTFRYYNFLGVVPRESEIEFAPEAGSSWETDDIGWFTWEEVQAGSLKGVPFHDGLGLLIKHSGSQIERLAKKDANTTLDK